MNIPGLRAATPSEQVQITACGLPQPDGSHSLVWPASDDRSLAFVVVVPGTTERRVKAVAAGDPADPIVAEAVVSAREAVIRALNSSAS